MSKGAQLERDRNHTSGLKATRVEVVPQVNDVFYCNIVGYRLNEQLHLQRRRRDGMRRQQQGY
ncbi:hypothetical protein WL29_21800 [Burkholderia ubonensis]|uniref:Uncharacterized protein n=1 Tax=Burkholderia ubonensis TaxID=101571 RepID=A0A119HFJ7_9BURK|nr:hypothetical protein WL29_21800 [Burkholderia ubonensis]